MTKKEEAQKEKTEAVERLRKLLKPGDCVRTILVHVSRSGMLRVIRPVFVKGDQTYDLTRDASIALGYSFDDRGGLKVGGCGMDMGFSVVYNLSRRLFPEGFKCIGKKNRCPSNDHFNGVKNRKHSDGGYALTQRWL